MATRALNAAKLNGGEAMAETVNQGNEIETNVEQEEKTFTQAELDRIVTDRLSRERAKYADYDALSKKAAKLDQLEEASKTELQKATDRASALQAELDALKSAETLRVMRETISAETGVPATLLTAGTEEECKEQAKAILAFAKPEAYPKVRDGGEVKSGPSKTTTRQQFADWFNKQA